MNFYKFFLSAMAICLSATINGEETEVDETDPAIEEIVVIGHPLSGEGLAQPFTILAGEELDRKAADSIGATVGSEPGIHNSSFGVVAGRPIIHGLGGARVRVLEDRIDTMDVSVTSGDHAVTVDPFIADRVEVLKGSGTLLYGSGAIGGVVDVHTGRIPHKVREDISGKLDLRAGNNGDGRNKSFHLDGGSGNFAWHFDSTARDAGDYAVPGFVESARLRALEAEEHDGDTDEEDHHEEEEDHHEEEEDHDEEEDEAYGVVPGSGYDVQSSSVGFSFVGERGFVGISTAKLRSEYGIPGHSHVEHGHDEEEEHEEDGHHEEEEEHEVEEEEHGEEGTPFIDLEQTRID
ncbi:MAG: TonB-dependent receptor plug domain-containing protein, partial [Gammaproteobacteria bacterium]|nr:TonB-dependent receptor plug domain-containing protein [Gammaproteobacteria bacterium]